MTDLSLFAIPQPVLAVPQPVIVVPQPVIAVLQSVIAVLDTAISNKKKITAPVRIMSACGKQTDLFRPNGLHEKKTGNHVLWLPASYIKTAWQNTTRNADGG